MVDDPNRKTPRQFQCRDYLWDSFEQLSTELECSIDYLINEAMRHYLRAQGRTAGQKTGSAPAATEGRSGAPLGAHGGNGGQQSVARQPTPPVPARPPAMPAMPSMPTARAPARPSMPQMPPAGPAIPPLGMGAGRTSPPVPAMPSLGHRPNSATASQSGMGGVGMGTAPPGVMNKPAPPPMIQRPPPPVAQAAQRTLFAVYGSEEVPVQKEEFFIGRGQKLCDLVIRDTNISRQHARVVLHNGQFWMIDNQSTNGVEFRGAKIQQKRIDEGDVFTICGHDVHFTYR